MRFPLIAAIFTFLFMTAGHMAVANARAGDIHAAIQECMRSAGKDGSGRPDHTAVDQCMQAKGFKKPEHPPRGEAHDGPPAAGPDNYGNPPPDE